MFPVNNFLYFQGIMLAYLAWVDTTPITRVQGENSMNCCQWPHVWKQTSLLNFARISWAVRRFLIRKLFQNPASGLDSKKPAAAPEKIIRLIACCIDFDHRQFINSILIFNEKIQFGIVKNISEKLYTSIHPPYEQFPDALGNQFTQPSN